MLAVMVTVVAVATTEMEVVTAMELERPAAMTLQAVLVERVAATVVASLKVSLKVLASELGLVLALELDRPVALALLVQAMPPESVAALEAAQVAAIMAGKPAVEAPDLEPEAVDFIKFSFSDKLEQEPKTRF